MNRFDHSVKNYKSQYNCDLHKHDYFQFNYVHKGCYIVYTDDVSILSMPGNLIVIPPYTPHRVEVLKDTQLSLITVSSTFDIVHESICNLDTPPLLTQILRIWESGGPNIQFEEEYKLVLLDQILQTNSVNSPLVTPNKVDKRLSLDQIS